MDEQMPGIAYPPYEYLRWLDSAPELRERRFDELVRELAKIYPGISQLSLAGSLPHRHGELRLSRRSGSTSYIEVYKGLVAAAIAFGPYDVGSPAA